MSVARGSTCTLKCASAASRTLADAPQRVVGQAPGYLVVLDALRLLQLVLQLQLHSKGKGEDIYIRSALSVITNQ